MLEKSSAAGAGAEAPVPAAAVAPPPDPPPMKSRPDVPGMVEASWSSYASKRRPSPAAPLPGPVEEVVRASGGTQSLAPAASASDTRSSRKVRLASGPMSSDDASTGSTARMVSRRSAGMMMAEPVAGGAPLAPGTGRPARRSSSQQRCAMDASREAANCVTKSAAAGTSWPSWAASLAVAPRAYPRVRESMWARPASCATALATSCSAMDSAR